MPNTKELLAEVEKQLGGLENLMEAVLEKAGEEGDDDVKKRVRLAKKASDDDEDCEDDDMDKKAKVAKEAAEKVEADKVAKEKVAKEAADKAEAEKVAKEAADKATKAKKKDDAKEGDDDEDDDSWSKKGLKKGEEEETLSVGDKTIAKSTVGSEVFAFMKAQQEQIAKDGDEIKKERDLRETAQFEKRADETYKHVPGTVAERGEVLKTISKMDKKLQKSFEAILNASEKLAKAAFEMTGSNGGSEELRKTAKAFESKVQDIKKRDECTPTEAMTKARQEDPEGFKAYQESTSN